MTLNSIRRCAVQDVYATSGHVENIDRQRAWQTSMSQHKRRFNGIAKSASCVHTKSQHPDQDAREARCVINRTILRPFN